MAQSLKKPQKNKIKKTLKMILQKVVKLSWEGLIYNSPYDML